MAKIIKFLTFISFTAFVPVLLAQNASELSGIEHIRKNDVFHVYVSYCNVDPNTLKITCPNLPEPRQGLSLKEYEAERIQWVKKYPEEFQAFLNLPSVKVVNPAPTQFGFEYDTTRKFHNGVLSIIESLGITGDKLKEYAPHFPRPKHTGDILRDESRYVEVINDWMNIYPEEVMNLYLSPEATLADPSGAKPLLRNNASFTSMKIGEKMPVLTDYDSGNPELDYRRYQLARQHWDYIHLSAEEYVKKYNIKDPHIDEEKKNGDIRKTEPVATPKENNRAEDAGNIHKH